MTDELRDNIIVMVKQGGGRLEQNDLNTARQNTAGS